MNLTHIKKTAIYFFSPVLLSALFSANSFCAEYSFNDILSTALQKNPSVKKAQLSVEQAKRSYYSSYSGFLPQVAAQASSSQSGSDSAGFSRQASMGLSASLSLFSGFSDKYAVEIKSLELETAKIDQKRTISDVVYSLRKSFINLLAAQETVALSEKIFLRRRENADMIRLKYEAGTEDKGSLLRVEADTAQAQYNLEKSRRALRGYSLELTRNACLETFDVITVTGTLATTEQLELGRLESSIEATLEYTAAKLTFEKAEKEEASSRSAFYPELSLSASTSKTGEEWMPGSDRWSAGLSLSYPLFKGGRDYFNLKNSKDKRLAYAEALRETMNQLAVRIDSAYTAYLDSLSQVSVTEKYLGASEIQSQITSEKYINGLCTYQDWYTIENDYISSTTSLLNIKRNAALSEAQLKNVLGQ